MLGWQLFKELGDAGKGSEELRETGFPFIATCLALGISYHQEECYSARVGLMSLRVDHVTHD